MTTTTTTTAASTTCRACHVARMLDADYGIGGEYLGEAEVKAREEQARLAGPHTCPPGHNNTVDVALVTMWNTTETWTVYGECELDGDVDDDGRTTCSFRYTVLQARCGTEVFDFPSDATEGDSDEFEAWAARFGGEYRDPAYLFETLSEKAREAEDERIARLDREAMARGDYDCFC